MKVAGTYPKAWPMIAFVAALVISCATISPKHSALSNNEIKIDAPAIVKPMQTDTDRIKQLQEYQRFKRQTEAAFKTLDEINRASGDIKIAQKELRDLVVPVLQQNVILFDRANKLRNAADKKDTVMYGLLNAVLVTNRKLDSSRYENRLNFEKTRSATKLSDATYSMFDVLGTALLSATFITSVTSLLLQRRSNRKQFA